MASSSLSMHVLLLIYLDFVQTGSTALLVAAQEGHSRVVEILLEANADVNIKKNVRPTMHSTCTVLPVINNLSVYSTELKVASWH